MSLSNNLLFFLLFSLFYMAFNAPWWNVKALFPLIFIFGTLDESFWSSHKPSMSLARGERERCKAAPQKWIFWPRKKKIFFSGQISTVGVFSGGLLGLLDVRKSLKKKKFLTKKFSYSRGHILKKRLSFIIWLNHYEVPQKWFFFLCLCIVCASLLCFWHFSGQKTSHFWG